MCRLWPEGRISDANRARTVAEKLALKITNGPGINSRPSYVTFSRERLGYTREINPVDANARPLAH